MDVELVLPFHNAVLSVQLCPGHPSPWHGSHTLGHDPVNIFDIISVLHILFLNSVNIFITIDCVASKNS